MRELDETAAAFDRAMRSASLGYALVGGLAVTAWGKPRAPASIEALLALGPSSVARLVLELQAEGFSIAEGELVEALWEEGHVTASDDRGSFQVDLKIARSFDEREQVAGAVEVPLAGTHLRVARPEDTLAHKLANGEPEDVEDATSILARQGKRLDEERLDALARRLGVVDELARLRSQVDG